MVFVKFPKFGLGNLLLMWANGFLFAHLNNLRFFTSPWWSINLGSWFRKEKNKRFYFGYFTSPSINDYLETLFIILFYKKIRNPILGNKYITNANAPIVFYYDSIVFNNHMFLNLLPYRDILKGEILNLLKADLRNSYFNMKKYDIGIHIRRGDFVITNQITSINYFVTVLKLIRETFQFNLLVKIFSDAYDYELEDILSLDGVVRSTNAEDILDLLELSKCKIIIMSKSSTFSYWAGFLSNGLVVKDKYDWQEKVCLNSNHELIFDIAKQDDFRKTLRNFSDLNFMK